MITYESAESFGRLFADLVHEQKQWSETTFGADTERGPIGALKHLEREAKEAQKSPRDVFEYADCLLLVLDAARRAGFSPMTLIRRAYEKLQVCKTRIYPKPIGDVPSEHVRAVCQLPAVFRTPGGKLLCRGHGGLVMANNGQGAVDSLPTDYIGSCSWEE